MKIKRISITLFVILIFICIFSFAYFKTYMKEESLDEKVNSEIMYYDSEIINLMAALNNVSLTRYIVDTKEVSTSNNKVTSKSKDNNNKEENNEENGDEGSTAKSNKTDMIEVSQMVANTFLDKDINDIDWETVVIKLETLISSWNTVILDLYKLNIQNETILAFSSSLDKTLIAAKDKNKVESLKNLYALYSSIQNIVNNYSDDIKLKTITNTKLNILSSYVFATLGYFDDAERELSNAEENYKNIMNNKDEIEKKEYNINKTYVALKELQNSTKEQDIDLYLLKCTILLNEINIL